MTEHHDHSEGEPRDTVVSGTEIEEEGDACDDPCEFVSGTETEEEGDACGDSFWGFILGIILGSSRGYDILKNPNGNPSGNHISYGIRLPSQQSTNKRRIGLSG